MDGRKSSDWRTIPYLICAAHNFYIGKPLSELESKDTVYHDGILPTQIVTKQSRFTSNLIEPECSVPYSQAPTVRQYVQSITER